MTDLELKNIEQLQKMTGHENEEIALKARNELIELEHDLSEKGIFIC